MAFLSRSILKYLALASLVLSTQAWAQDVQTYTDQAVPSQPLPQYDRYNSPLQAGQLTLQDVLSAHRPQKPNPALAPPVVTSGASQAPLLSPASQATSANVMLQQGLQSILQQPTTGKPVQLQAPQLPSAAPVVENGVQANSTAVQPIPTPVDVPVPPGVTYEPGQQPKNLAGAASSSAVGGEEQATSGVFAPATQTAATTTDQTASQPATAATGTSKKPKASSGANTGNIATPGCNPSTQHWTKTCIEAGYPDTFTGKITGETRTVCPDKSLQDVWIANSCAPPGEGGAAESVAPVGEVSDTGATTTAAAEAAARNTNVRADASCGTANGLAAAAAPTSNLCSFGDASEVSGDGPWRWNCKGLSGGMTVSCAAPVVPGAAQTSAAAATNAGPANKPANAVIAEDGMCGSSDGMGTDRPPASNLCAKGNASRVNGSGPWTWACSGLNGGSAAACSASKKVDGACGVAGKTGADQMPTNDLCNAGYASAVTGDGPWNWTCSGLYGGNPVTCSAAPKKDAVCGNASLNGHHDAPRDSLCSVGEAGTVHGSGPWNWTCNGSNGGSAVSCNAPISVSGACGYANGVAVSKAPTDQLCSHGTPTRVTGTGPWNWNCSGSDGGDTQGCTATVAAPTAAAMTSESEENSAALAPIASSSSTSSSTGGDLCGSASELMALEAPDKDLCSSGRASDVGGNGPWTWTCDDGSHTSNCSTLSPMGNLSEAPATKATKAPAARMKPAVAAAPAEDKLANCGYAAGQGVAQAPVDGLCSVGKASTVRGGGPWTWTCVKDKSKATCNAPKLQDGVCGVANGSVQKFAPARGLCSSGTSTDIQGTGPWLWTCVGTGGGGSSSCSAAAQSQTRVDGSCGAASNNTFISTPDANLCDSGIASNVYGDGPWTWTCSGLNGGIATSCSAQKTMAAAPPPPGPAVNGLCGNSNGVAMVAQPVEDLCAGGTATATSGNGPWNWNCLGSNGGMTVSCTAPLQPPAPITGMCGSANGVPTLTLPRGGLCSAGISSAVSGKGPWTWSCSGTNGGGAVGCVAPLAGTDVGAAPLPSLSSTPSSDEAPVPQAAPMNPVTSSGLVTPKLGSQPLPPKKNSSRLIAPNSDFGTAPQATVTPTAPAYTDIEAPSEPGLPADSTPLTPPPIRDTLAPSPALAPPAIDSEGNVIPGNHFVLPRDVASISFSRGSENINEDEVPKLDKLAAILLANGNVRVTLTSYADNSNGMSPRDARRLSLTRALAIRDYLTTKGISSGRIDVRALGANMPTDMTLSDRVDVKAN